MLLLYQLNLPPAIGNSLIANLVGTQPPANSSQGWYEPEMPRKKRKPIKDDEALLMLLM